MKLLLSALGWTLMYSALQGLVIGLTAWLGLRCARTARERYLISSAAIFALPLLSGLTLVFHLQPELLRRVPLGLALQGRALSMQSADYSSVGDSLSRSVEWAGPVGAFWLAGAVLLLSRQVYWIYRSRRLRSGVPARAEWQVLARVSAEFLGVRTQIHVVESTVVDSPVVLGLRTATIVLPSHSFSQLDRRQALGVLVHELAHVRRRDYLVNLIQVAIASVFFFQPVVRRLVRAAAEERERICDEVAASACGSALCYARALVRLEEQRSLVPHLVVGAASATLASRIAALVAPSPRPASHGFNTRAAASASLAAALLISATLAALPATVRAVDDAGYTVNAYDAAGPFTVTLQRGRVVAATINGVPLQRAQIVQRRDSIYLRVPAASNDLALALNAQGGFSWTSRPAH